MLTIYEAVDLMNKRASSLQGSQVLRLLPESWNIATILPALRDHPSTPIFLNQFYEGLALSFTSVFFCSECIAIISLLAVKMSGKTSFIKAPVIQPFYNIGTGTDPYPTFWQFTGLDTGFFS